MVFLDTNIVVGIMTGRAPDLVARFKTELIAGTRMFLPTHVLFELRYGVRRSAFPERNFARLADFLLAAPDMLPFESDDAAEAADIRAFFEKAGTPIGAIDVLVAGQTRRRQMVLVTRNRREFDRVPGLMVTDWGIA